MTDAAPFYLYRVDCRVRFPDDEEDLDFGIELKAHRLPVIGEAINVHGKELWRLRITDVHHDIGGNLDDATLFELVTDGPVAPRRETLRRELLENREANGLVEGFEPS